MKEIVDLSGVIENGMWGYEVIPSMTGLMPETKIESISSISNNGFFSSKIQMSTLTGSYIESGAHLIVNGKMINDHPVEDFIKPASVMHINRQNKKLITLEMIKEAAENTKMETGDAILLDSFYGNQWGKHRYVEDCPVYSNKALSWLLERKPSILAFDVPCIAGASGVNEGDSNLLYNLFNQDIILIAPLINMDKIVSYRGTLIALPLNVKGVSGVPGRIIFTAN